MPRAPGIRITPYVGYEPDARLGDVLVEVKEGAHSFRNVRASLLGLAYLLANDPAARGVMVLVDSRITRPRLERELELARQALRPGVMERLNIVLEKEGEYSGVPASLGPKFIDELDAVVRRASPAKRAKTSKEAILQILLHQSLLGKGPMTTDWLMKTAGASYPTVASALQRLEHVIRRHSDRRVELRYFPREEWTRLIAISEELRFTRRFTDRSGQRRSPEALLRRLTRGGQPAVAAGGVLAARHYLPEIDISGIPRLDLSVHAVGKVDWSFVKRLDPGLEPTERRDEPVALAVHVVRRAESLFQRRGRGKDSLSYADPVDCLLDLHEAHLAPQADQLLRFFVDTRVAKDSEGKLR